jgi:Uma2 family endonuclease
MAMATQLMKAEDFHDWCRRPENAHRHFELVRGKVVEMPPPGERHGVVCTNVGWVLGGYIRRVRKGYACSNDTGVIWERDPDTVRGPDLMYYDDSRRFEEFHPKYTENVPRLAVEVLSPADRLSAVNRRMSQYLKWGVALVWLVDPEDRTVTIYRPDRPPEVLDADQELTGDGVLPDFSCPVSDFFYAAGEGEPQVG